MILAPLIKGAAALCITITMAPECKAQANAWYQQYQQQYYPGYTYTTGRYAHQQQQAPAPAAASHQPPQPKAAPATDRWYSSFDSAWKKANEQGKPLVVLFVHHGCPECDRMDATLSQPAASHTLDSAVKVRLEFSQNAELVHRWGIKFTPTFLVLSPAHQGEVYREVGALSIDRLRVLQPSIEGLVTQPQAPKKKSKDSSAAIDLDSIPEDKSTSRTMAAM